MTAMAPGRKLKRFRMRLGLTTRGVEAHSKKLADEKGNLEFAVSAPWLTQLENNNALPSIFKLYSLSVLYKVAYAELLRLYGVNLAEIGRDQIAYGLDRTSLLDTRIEETAKSMVIPVRFDPHLSMEATTLVNGLVQSWGKVPVSLFQYINTKHFFYGVIGTRDEFMHPLIPPGSFVQIDPLKNKIRSGIWQSDYERPIYFCETRDTFICGWCHFEDHRLTLIPHPLSKATMLNFKFPEEIEVVGQVVGIAARIDQRETKSLSEANPR